MSIPHEALELENRHIGTEGEPTLAEAFRILRSVWDSGIRNRELGLHLLFLSWYGQVEPPFLTGFLDSPQSDELQSTFAQVFEYFQPTIESDPELLFVVGLQAELFPWTLGDEKLWENRAAEYRRRYQMLVPDGIDPTIFRNRGFYGEYFFGHAEGNSFRS